MNEMIESSYKVWSIDEKQNQFLFGSKFGDALASIKTSLSWPIFGSL